MMIIQLENTNQLDKESRSILGQQDPVSWRRFFRSTGSCLYHLKKIQYANSIEKVAPQENARCNFEKFPNGMLLRINDRQHFYVLPLKEDNLVEMNISRGKEKVSFFSWTALLFFFGFPKDYLRKYWLLSGGFYHGRFTLSIKTSTELVFLDAHGGNFKSAIHYFEDSNLMSKIKICT